MHLLSFFLYLLSASSVDRRNHQKHVLQPESAKNEPFILLCLLKT